ncbi:MAG: hypothetical protein U0746_07625 [Gemmataceae bacterium]
MTVRLSLVCVVTFLGLAPAADTPVTGVGVAGKLEQLVLPGTELEVKPIEDRKAKVVLRIVGAYKHGTAYRYDIEYYGLEAGKYDLRELLQRKDGGATTDLPSIPVEVKGVLPPGHVLPHDPVTGGGPSIGGYRKLVYLALAAWALVMIAIVFLGRRQQAETKIALGRPVTLADRLRPLVERGARGELSPTDRADLERTLMAFWRTRLGLTKSRPADAIASLKQNPDSGPLLKQLEAWLHKPGSSEGVDVASLLRPYQNLPANALDAVIQHSVTAT